MNAIDTVVAACLAPLAVTALVCGLDDFVLDVAMVWGWLRRSAAGPRPSRRQLRDLPEKRLAVFLPLWQEHAVIGAMLRHNVEAIHYGNYDIFAGCYANDPTTQDAIRQAEARYRNVHLTIVPHDGPTSKADCLNWIYQGMLAHEEACGGRFEVVVTHDAEDVVHPESLRYINYYAQHYDMIQIPVLPLPTPVWRFTHGVYCDEFAEFQTKDVPVRPRLGGFVPSNGVGTGYVRRALEKLADAGSNRVFDPACLTEDYDCGFRLHHLGFRQLFVPIRFLDGKPMATREYFPQRFRQAVRQRTRWVIGIALQGWERHGWGDSLASAYWFWRDRKGLAGNLLSLYANLVSFYGLATWAHSRLTGHPWWLGEVSFGSWARLVVAAALTLQTFRILMRTGCSARIYGWAFALGAPLRTIWANWMNAIATILAIARYARTALLRQPHVWLKTEHTYPALDAPKTVVLPRVELNSRLVPRRVARALPERVAERWKVLPLQIAEGRLFLATTVEPTAALQKDLRRHTGLEVCFQLVSTEDFERLRSGSWR